ncbi:hypothetical protein, partial [Streptomyces diastaticus]
FTGTVPVALVADTSHLDTDTQLLVDYPADEAEHHLFYDEVAAEWMEEVARAAVALVAVYATRPEPVPVPVVVKAYAPGVAHLVAERLADIITAMGITATTENRQ